MMDLPKTVAYSACALAMCGLVAPAQAQSFITGTVQGPDGAALEGATVYVCTGLVEAKREEPREGQKGARMALYYSTAKAGDGKCEGTGKSRKAGEFKVRYPEGKEADLFAWKEGFEAMIVRGVSSPSDVGAVKLPGTNDTKAVEKRNIEALQKAEKQKADNQEGSRQARLKRWQEHERNFPDGVHVSAQKTYASQDNSAQEQTAARRIKGKLLTPQGQPVAHDDKAPVLILFGRDLQLEKRTPQNWRLKNVASLGNLYEDGNLDLIAQQGQWDVFIWVKGYEPLLLREVRAPSDLGSIKLTGPNTELEKVFR